MKIKTLLLTLLAAALTANAAIMTVTFDTTGLTGPGQFSFGAQLIDGGTLNNNSAALSAFQFGGGAAGTVSGLSNASGNMLSTVTFDNSVFFGYFEQAFTPGSMLRFVLNVGENSDGVTPDQFSLQLYHDGNQILTDDPGGAFLYFDLGGSMPVVNTYSSTIASGGFNVAAPSVAFESGSAIPEPSTYGVVGAGLAVVIGLRRSRKRSQ